VWRTEMAAGPVHLGLMWVKETAPSSLPISVFDSAGHFFLLATSNEYELSIYVLKLIEFRIKCPIGIS